MAILSTHLSDTAPHLCQRRLHVLVKINLGRVHFRERRIQRGHDVDGHMVGRTRLPHELPKAVIVEAGQQRGDRRAVPICARVLMRG